MKNHQQIYLFVIFFIFIFTISKPVYSLVSNNNEIKTILLKSEIIKLYSISHEDSTNNKVLFDSLSSYYKNHLHQVLSIKLQEIRLDENIQLIKKYNETGIVITSTITQNSEGKFIISIVINEDKEILTLGPPVVIKKNKLTTRHFNDSSWGKINRNEPENTETARLLNEIASFFVTYVEERIFRWIVEKYSKIAVFVGKFELYTDSLSTTEPNYTFMKDSIKKMIEGELVKSEIIRIYKVDTLFIDYKIEGAITVLNDKISIDLNCIKYPYGMILTSKNLIIDTIDVKKLRYNIRKEIKEFRAIIEADFIKTDKRLFVSAFPPSKLFSSDETSEKDIQIVLEIVRSFTQKLRILKQNEADSTIQVGNIFVISDKDKVRYYIKNKTSPGEIISDLGIDYLVMINYEDIGNEIRLSAELYSADCSIGSFVDFIEATIKPKSLLSETVDDTVIKIDNKIDEYLNRYLRTRKEKHKLIKEVHTPVIHDIWGFGCRWGIITDRVDPDLFLGKTASTYVELFYEYIPRTLFFWGEDFEIGVEPMIGFDFTTGYFSTVLAMNAFINVKLIYTLNLRYSVLPLRLKAGCGYGAQAIRYSFSPGDKYYLGDKRKTDFEPQKDRYNYFGSMEFPISQKFGLVVLFRVIPKSGKTINKFINYPLDVENTPKGRFGGIHYVAGIRYTWR